MSDLNDETWISNDQLIFAFLVFSLSLERFKMRICRRNRRNEERIAGNANNPLCCFRGVWRICFSGILINSKGRKDMWGLLWWWNLWSYNSVTKADNFEASLGYIVKYCLKITVYMWTWYTLQRYWELERWKCMQLPDLEINCYMFHVHKKTSGQWNSYSYNSFSIKIKTLYLFFLLQIYLFFEDLLKMSHVVWSTP